MKKYLFISNVSHKITNFAIPSIEAAQSLGYEVHLAANYRDFKDDPEKYGVILHHIDIARSPFHKQNLTAYKQMMELLKKDKFDVIHCNTPVGGLLGRVCGAKTGVRKILYTAHGFHFYKGAPWINKTVFKFIEKRLAHQTDAILTMNREDFDTAQCFRLRTKNGKVYFVHGVGIDSQTLRETTVNKDALRSELGIPKEAVLLISVGELNKNKNNKIVIEALGGLKRQDIHYIVCGAGGEEENLQQLATQVGTEKQVHFLRYRTDIPQLLKAADIFVLTSFREGLSRSIMEAMAAGLPCMVSNIRGNVDLIQESKGGFLCSPQDSKYFAEKLDELASDEQLRLRMGAFNLQAVESYDVQNVKREMMDIYLQELLIQE